MTSYDGVTLIELRFDGYQSPYLPI